MISQIVKNNFHFLKQLAKTRSLQKRKRLLKQATIGQLISISEICLNILRNKFQLTKRQKGRLVPFADFVRRIGRVRTERGARKLVIQKGNGLPLGLFPALLTPIIIELAKNLTTNKNGQ